MAESISIPPELQPVLRDFTKAVMKEQPTNLLHFARDYFVEQATEERVASYALPPSESQVFMELSKGMQTEIENIFKRYDTDCDMAISIDELRVLCNDLGEVFGFEGEVDLATLLALLDADASNSVSWQEWSHACAVWISELGVN